MLQQEQYRGPLTGLKEYLASPLPLPQPTIQDPNEREQSEEESQFHQTAISRVTREIASVKSEDMPTYTTAPTFTYVTSYTACNSS